MANEMQCCPVCGKLAKFIDKVGRDTVIRHQSKRLKDCIQEGEKDE